MARIESVIEKIYAHHTMPGIRSPGYMSRQHPYRHAKISLWAITQKGHHVWLKTKKGLDTRRIETKIREFEQEYEYLLGMKIEYILKTDKYTFDQTGFVRKIGDEEVDWSLGYIK
jgi:hypothetical protein